MAVTSPDENPYSTPTVDPVIPDLNPVEELELATRAERFAGSLLDSLLIAVPLIVLDVFSERFNFLPSNPYVTNALHLGFFFALNLWLLATRGQTIGKVAMRTKIVTPDGSRPSLGRLIGLRYVPLYTSAAIPVVGDWIQLLNALFIFRGDKRCLHDLLAGTKVVKIGRLVREMPQARLMPRRNPAHAAHILSKLLLDELGLVPAKIQPDSRWIEDLGISPESFAAFCRKLESRFNTLTLAELEKCATYGDLLQLLGIPLTKRPR